MSTDSAAILFADVSGSSRLFKRVGDAKARAIVSAVVDMMMDKTRAHQGVVIKTIGDECMSSFADAGQAAHAAIAMQNDISSNDYGAPLSIRIGFHCGPVIHEDGDVYGEAVNDAADLVKIAKGGQIITCQRTVDQLNNALQDRCSRFDQIRIKGGTAREIIYLMEWEEQAQNSNATQFIAPINTTRFHQAESSTLYLYYQGKTIELDKNRVPFTIGRDDRADLTVDFSLASREHCTIDYRRGKFVLIDNSTNGTHVAPEGRNPLYLRREETPLMNKGVISFSPEVDQNGPHILRFSC